jgi:hypothetical protein
MSLLITRILKKVKNFVFICDFDMRALFAPFMPLKNA